jgi:hypothetical protein
MPSAFIGRVTDPPLQIQNNEYRKTLSIIKLGDKREEIKWHGIYRKCINNSDFIYI